MKINKWLLVTTLALSSIGLVSCQQKKVQEAEVVSSASVKTPREIIKSPVKKTDFLLGTAVALSVYHPNTEELLTRAFEMVKDLEARITVNASGSEVDAINEASGDHAVAVSDEVYDLIKQGLAYSEEFDGSFDITVGPLTSLWRIGFPDARKPSQKEIDDALPLVNYKNVVLNDEEKSVYLTQKGMLLDLGGIAKGFIADQLWSFFKKEGVTTAVLDLGGNIVVMGGSPARDGVAWNVGLQDPLESRGKTLGTILEKEKTIVTSGIYERQLVVDGKTYHHIFDRTTGYPMETEVASITILAKKSVDCEIWTTRLFGQNPHDIIEEIEQQPGLEAFVITKNQKMMYTSGIQFV